jgi:hypothetical protein
MVLQQMSAMQSMYFEAASLGETKNPMINQEESILDHTVSEKFGNEEMH